MINKGTTGEKSDQLIPCNHKNTLVPVGMFPLQNPQSFDMLVFLFCNKCEAIVMKKASIKVNVIGIPNLKI